MPSEYQKKKLAKKKEAAKQKGGKKTSNDVEENGVSNDSARESRNGTPSTNGANDTTEPSTTYEGKARSTILGGGEQGDFRE